jgi:hypothetical protein
MRTRRDGSGKIWAVQWRRIGISALIAVALVAIVAGFMQAQTGDDQATLVDPGIEVPDDQLTLNDALNQVFFQPGPGKEFEQFAPGRHCVTAHFYKTIEGPETAHTYSWCFNVS